MKVTKFNWIYNTSDTLFSGIPYILAKDWLMMNLPSNLDCRQMVPLSTDVQFKVNCYDPANDELILTFCIVND